MVNPAHRLALTLLGRLASCRPLMTSITSTCNTIDPAIFTFNIHVHGFAVQLCCCLSRFSVLSKQLVLSLLAGELQYPSMGSCYHKPEPDLIIHHGRRRDPI